MANEKIPRTISQGICNLCHVIVAKNTVTKHLQSHRKEIKSTNKAVNFFHLVVEGRFNPAYWLHLQIPINATLEDLDSFLRSIWLECCDHLSAFTIAGANFSSSPDGDFDDSSTNIPIKKVLSPKVKGVYQYDFGTTTDLSFKVIEEYPGEGKDILLLARNESPLLICMQCKNNAVRICSECTWEGETGLLCKKHLEKHEHNSDMSLPVVNSPRIGICAYAG